MKILRLAAIAAALLLSLPADVQAQTTLRIGLAEDPDILDPTHGAHLCRPHRVRRLLRQAVRHRRKAQHRAAARAVARDLRRRQGGHDQAAARREIPRRRAVQRRGREILARAPSDHAGLVPQAGAGRARSCRRRRSPHHQARAEGAVLAADRAAHRSRRHDGLAEGGQGRRRQVRAAPGLRRALQIRRARAAGPHRVREIRRLLGQGQCPHRPHRVSAASSTPRCGSPT